MLGNLNGVVDCSAFPQIRHCGADQGQAWRVLAAHERPLQCQEGDDVVVWCRDYPKRESGHSGIRACVEDSNALYMGREKKVTHEA